MYCEKASTINGIPPNTFASLLFMYCMDYESYFCCNIDDGIAKCLFPIKTWFRSLKKKKAILYFLKTSNYRPFSNKILKITLV